MPSVKWSPGWLEAYSETDLKQWGTTYGQSLAIIGGAAPYTWLVSVGSLPSSLSLSSGGVISGKPTVTGNFGITVQVKDNVSETATKL